MMASLSVIIVKKKNVSGFTSLTFLVWQIALLFRMKKNRGLGAFHFLSQYLFCYYGSTDMLGMDNAG